MTENKKEYVLKLIEPIRYFYEQKNGLKFIKMEPNVGFNMRVADETRLDIYTFFYAHNFRNYYMWSNWGDYYKSFKFSETEWQNLELILYHYSLKYRHQAIDQSVVLPPRWEDMEKEFFEIANRMLPEEIKLEENQE